MLCILHVMFVAWHATCQLPIGSYRLLGGNMLTRGILTRGTRYVVDWHATCQLPIGSYRLLGGNMLTCGTLTRASH